MKKKLKILLLSFLCLLVFPIYTKAWDEIGTGEGVDTGGGGNCTDASGCCFCRWNNKNFGSIKLTIVYYDGTTRHKLGNKTHHQLSPFPSPIVITNDSYSPSLYQK